MVEQIKPKRVPWSQFEEYLATHKKTIGTIISMKKSASIDIPEIEDKLTMSLLQLHSVIGDLLKANDIIVPN